MPFQPETALATTFDFSPTWSLPSLAMRVSSTGRSCPGVPTSICRLSVPMARVRLACFSLTVYTVLKSCRVSMSWYRYVLAWLAVISP